MNPRPTVWTRFLARLGGEVPADTLEAYRRASLAVYDALTHCEGHRANAKQHGKNAWTLPPATQAEMLCTWNAFVLQTLGDKILEADYAQNPRTVGFVPPVTSDQVLAFYGQVEGWLTLAQQAHVSPDFVLNVAVPAELPPWSEVEPCPDSHLMGMLEAMRAVRLHTEAALIFLNASPPTTDAQSKGLNVIREVHGAAAAKARYAEDMMGGRPTRDVHERVEEHVKGAIEALYLVGQLLSMPELASKVGATPGAPAGDRARAAAAGSPPPILFAAPAAAASPDDPRFDMWCLTDPEARERFKDDPQARRAIKTLWQLDPDPRRTLQIQAEIDAAFARGDIAYVADGGGRKLGHFFCAPWGAVYVVRRPVTLAGRRLRTLQQFVFNVTCEGVNLGTPFERDILTGNFAPTTQFEYGDPDEEPDH